MLINPDIEEWFSRLQGKSAPRGGGAAGRSIQGYAPAALEGIVKPGSGMFGFNAPAIRSNYRPTPIAPSPPERSPSGIPPVAPSSQGSGARDLGGGAIAAGLGKLGQGIETGIKGYVEKRKANAAAAALGRPYGDTEPRSFLTPRGAGGAGGAGGVAGDESPRSVPSPYVPSTVGEISTLPIQAQEGGGRGEAGTSIGPAGSLPTFAAGAPGATQTAGVGSIAGNIAAARYNNPGNVSLPISGWSGGGNVVGIKNQPGYASFPDMQTGMAAFSQRLNNYIGRGLNTISALNSSYAQDPKWAAGVSAASGIGPNTPLDPSNADQMRALQNGILSQEIGPQNAASALGAARPPLTAPSASAYAAAPPNLTGQASSQLAGAAPTPNAPSEPRLISPGQPQTGPAYSDETWNNRPQYDYGAPSGAATVPIPSPPQSPLLNGGQPGVYSMPDKQGMNEPSDLSRGTQQERDYFTNFPNIPSSPEMPKSLAPLPNRQFPTGPGNLGVADNGGMNALAAALAQGSGQSAPPIDQSALLAMALAQQQPNFANFATPDFGGFGDFFG